MTYTFTASAAGHARLLQRNARRPADRDGLYGAIIVLPAERARRLHDRASCDGSGNNAAAKTHWGEADFRLAPAAYDHPKTCYDREYLFQWAEMDPRIHTAGSRRRSGQDWAARRGTGMQSRCTDRALPSRVLPDQRALDA